MSEVLKLPMPTWQTVELVSHCFTPVLDAAGCRRDRKPGEKLYGENPIPWLKSISEVARAGLAKLEDWQASWRDPENDGVWVILRTARATLAGVLAISTSPDFVPGTEGVGARGVSADQLQDWIRAILELGWDDMARMLREVPAAEADIERSVLGKMWKVAEEQEVGDA